MASCPPPQGSDSLPGLQEYVTALAPDGSAVVQIARVREEGTPATFDLLKVSIGGDTLLHREKDLSLYFRRLAALSLIFLTTDLVFLAKALGFRVRIFRSLARSGGYTVS